VKLDLIGGPAYLAEIINQHSFIGQYRKLCEACSWKSILRKVIDANSRISEQAYNSEYENIDNFLDQVEGEIFAISEEKKTAGLVPAKDLVKASLDIIEERYHAKAQLTGISSGYTELDKMTSGFNLEISSF